MKIIRVVHSVKDAKINPYSEDINNIINQISYTEKCYEIIRNSRCERFILPATEEMPIDMKLGLLDKSEEYSEEFVPAFLRELFELDITAVMKNTIYKFLEMSLQPKIETISLGLAKKRYPSTQNLSIGTYTLHPCDGKKLNRLENYHKNLALEKDNELIVLLGRMGAKTVKIIETDSQKKSGSANLGVETIKVNGGGKFTAAKEIDQGKELLVIFEGSIVDIDEKLLINSIWFTNDGQLNAIFEGRRFTHNKIQQYTLKNTYTETFDFDFDLAAKFLIFKTDLKAEYEAISKKERLFHVEFGS